MILFKKKIGSSKKKKKYYWIMSRSSYAASNLFNFVNNGRIFEYKIEIPKENKKDVLNSHIPLYKEIESNFPKGFLTKLVNFQAMKFFSVSFKAKFSVRLVIREELVEIKFECLGELKDLGAYYNGMTQKIFSKSKLANIGEYHFNPFEINNVSPEYSMMPIFKARVDRTLDEHKLCVKNEIFFNPSKSLLDVIKGLLVKESREKKIHELFVGSMVKVKYPAWERYFRVVRFLTDSRLEDHEIEVEGVKVGLLAYFREKYPYLKIENENQFLVEAEVVSSRSDISGERKTRILIPEFLNLMVDHEKFKVIFGFDYYKKFKISRFLYKYFYTSRFIGNVLEKPSVKKMLTLWRLEIEKKSEILRFVKPDFYPEYLMVSPQGPSKLQKNLADSSQDFEYQALQYRMSQFTPFKKWAVFCSKGILEKVTSALKSLTECGEHFKYFSTKPECFFVESDSETHWKDGLKNQIKKDFEVVICFTQNNENTLTRILLNYSLPYVVKKLKENEKIDIYFAHKLIHRIGMARYDQPWTICQLGENQPTMFAALSINYIKKVDVFSICFVFSKNKFFTKYFQKVLCVKNSGEGFEDEVKKQVKVFFARVGKFFRLNVVDLDFRAVCYVSSNDEKYSEKCRMIRKTTTKYFEKLTCGSYVLIHVSKMENFEFCPAGNKSVRDVRVMSYRVFDDFYRSQKRLFRYFPECQILDFSSKGTVKFLIMSKLDNEKKLPHGPVHRYFVLSAKNFDIEGNRKWVVDRTLMLGCVDFCDVEGYYGLPSVVVYAERIVRLLKSGRSEGFGEFVEMLNKFKYPVYVGD